LVLQAKLVQLVPAALDFKLQGLSLESLACFFQLALTRYFQKDQSLVQERLDCYQLEVEVKAIMREA
jgi:hypothetical protein